MTGWLTFVEVEVLIPAVINISVFWIKCCTVQTAEPIQEPSDPFWLWLLSASSLSLAWFTLQPLVWKRYVSPKRRFIFNRLHGVISQARELGLHTKKWLNVKLGCLHPVACTPGIATSRVLSQNTKKTAPFMDQAENTKQVKFWWVSLASYTLSWDSVCRILYWYKGFLPQPKQRKTEDKMWSSSGVSV
jgi:hypothetical protein